MEFVINNNKWNIYEKSKKEITDKYNEDLDEDAKCIFGLTMYPEHEIWINSEMVEDHKLKTLKHELTHCFIESYGLGQVPNFTEEMVCDVVSSINDWINEMVKKYKLWKEDKDE